VEVPGIVVAGSAPILQLEAKPAGSPEPTAG
jgi:hypothetical protein